MWFKNLRIFQLQQTFAYQPEQLAEDLASFKFEPCSSLTPQSKGWVSPLGGETGALVHASNGFMLITLKIQRKLMPPAVINEQLSEKMRAIEQQEQRKVGRKEKQNLKDEIYHTLLPRAFTQSSTVSAYIDTQDGLLVVDAAVANVAEDLIDVLRKTLGSLKVVLPQVTPPAVMMTDWLRNQKVPGKFIAEDACLLQDTRDKKSLIRCQKHDLFAPRIQALLQGNYLVTQMALSWAEQIAFILQDDFAIKQLKFLEDVKAQSEDVNIESDEQRFDADFAIMSGTLREYLRELLPALGYKPSQQFINNPTQSVNEPVVEAE
ncbi:MAG: recombination-associated protein RdgC [Gammaproteobacteria bacterium]